jgi:hypothetical protein
VVARPRVLEDGGADGGGEVQALVAGAVDLELGQDPERLGVALEPVGEAETFPGEPVERPLAEVPERRVTEVVRAGRRLYPGRRWPGRPPSP